MKPKHFLLTIVMLFMLTSPTLASINIEKYTRAATVVCENQSCCYTIFETASYVVSPGFADVDVCNIINIKYEKQRTACDLFLFCNNQEFDYAYEFPDVGKIDRRHFKIKATKSNHLYDNYRQWGYCKTTPFVRGLSFLHHS
jgi:hypothetical protein